MLEKVKSNNSYGETPACLQLDIGEDLMSLTEEFLASSVHDTPGCLVRSLLEREIGDYLAGKEPSVSCPVRNPSHYNSHPSGIECIEITEDMTFCLGNATKYIWRAGLKQSAVQDLQKAIWYIEREVNRRKREESKLLN